MIEDVGLLRAEKKKKQTDLVMLATKAQNIPQLSLKCHSIYLGIHKDPSILRAAYNILMAAGFVAGTVS